MKIFYKIILVIKIWRIKMIWDKFDKISSNLKKSISEEKKFKKLFIVDEEDEILNKKILDKYKSNINKIKIKKDKLKVKLNKKIVKIDLFNPILFLKFEEYKINPNNISFLRLIVKDYLKQNNK